jgi:hypothetical protein
MQEPPKPRHSQSFYDFLMVLLCSQASYWLLASPLVPYVFNEAQFLVSYVLLTIVLGTVGVKLNHLAARNVRVSIGIGRRRR